MKSLVLIFSLLLLSIGTHASTPVLGVVMNFDCPHCKTTFKSRNLLEGQCSGLKSEKCRLAYIPFPNDSKDYRAIAFYIAKNKSGALSKKVADIFYEYDPKGPLIKPEVITLLETLSPGTSWQELFSGKSEDEGRQSLYRAANLLKLLKVTDYPTFLWLTEIDAKVIPTVQDPTKRLDSVINYLGKIK